jgi:hypothetical protein
LLHLCVAWQVEKQYAIAFQIDVQLLHLCVAWQAYFCFDRPAGVEALEQVAASHASTAARDFLVATNYNSKLGSGMLSSTFAPVGRGADDVDVMA